MLPQVCFVIFLLHLFPNRLDFLHAGSTLPFVIEIISIRMARHAFFINATPRSSYDPNMQLSEKTCKFEYLVGCACCLLNEALAVIPYPAKGFRRFVDCSFYILFLCNLLKRSRGYIIQSECLQQI